MTKHRSNIVMVKMGRSKEVQMLNGRHFLARYKRVNQNVLPANIRIAKTYGGRPTRGRQVRLRLKVKPAHQIRAEGVKSFAQKAFKFAKKFPKIRWFEN